MPNKNASPRLKELFAQELANDPNATLQSARLHLRDLDDSAPGDAAGRHSAWLTEVEELIHTHQEHCPLSDFVGPPT